MELSNATLFPTINFFHFVAAGVVLPVLSKQITKYGGNFVILGAMNSVIFIAHAISKDVIELFNWGQLDIIKFSLCATFVYFVMLVFAKIWWLVFLIRIGYALTTQVLQYSKEFIKRTEPRSRKTKICNMIDIMRVLGLTIGSMLGGLIYDRTKNVTHNSLLGIVFTVIPIYLFSYIQHEEFDIFTTDSQIFTYQKSIVEQFRNLRTVKFKHMWPRVVLKLSYLFTFVTFFGRFIFVLCQNYKVTSMIVGWVRGYHYILRFIFSFIAPFIIEKTRDKRSLFAHSMVISGASLVALFYAPTYNCYLVCFIPVILSYMIVNSLLSEDILNFKSDMTVYQATETLGVIINILSPIIYGVLHQYSGATLTKILALAPAAIWAYLLHQNIFGQKKKIRRYSFYDAASLKQIFKASFSVEEFPSPQDSDDEEVIDEDDPEESLDSYDGSVKEFPVVTEREKIGSILKHKRNTKQEVSFGINLTKFDTQSQDSGSFESVAKKQNDK